VILSRNIATVIETKTNESMIDTE